MSNFFKNLCYLENNFFPVFDIQFAFDRIDYTTSHEIIHIVFCYFLFLRLHFLHSCCRSSIYAYRLDIYILPVETRFSAVLFEEVEIVYVLPDSTTSLIATPSIAGAVLNLRASVSVSFFAMSIVTRSPLCRLSIEI